MKLLSIGSDDMWRHRHISSLPQVINKTIFSNIYVKCARFNIFYVIMDKGYI